MISFLSKFKIFNNRKVEGLFTILELIDYLEDTNASTSKKPGENFLLVNEINENTRNLVGKDENYLMKNIHLLEDVEVNSSFFKKKVYSNKDLSNLFMLKLSFRGDFSHFIFREFNFSNSNLSYLNANGVNFRYCNFTQSAFLRTNFSFSNLSNSDFSHTFFEDTDFTESDFSNCEFSNTNFSNSNFHFSKFKNSNFSNIKPLTTRRNILISNNLKLTTSKDLDSCSNMEKFNLEKLRAKENFKLIEMRINGKKELIGILKIDPYEIHSFLSFQTVLNKNGEVVLIRGFQYALDSSVYRYLISQEEKIIFELEELKVMTLRFNQSDAVNFKTIYKEILKFLKLYEEGYFDESDEVLRL